MKSTITTNNPTKKDTNIHTKIFNPKTPLALYDLDKGRNALLNTMLIIITTISSFYQSKLNHPCVKYNELRTNRPSFNPTALVELRMHLGKTIS
jgi:hypothetical protein